MTRDAYGYGDQNPLSNNDPLGLCWGPDVICSIASTAARAGGSVNGWLKHHTVAYCENAGAGLGPYVGASVCIGFVGTKPTLLVTPRFGGSTPAASLTGGLMISNATCSKQLSGWFGEAGASGTLAGVAVGNDGSLGVSDGKTIWADQVSVGAGPPLPIWAEAHASASYTWAFTL
jgi:hypothetical protein